MTSTCPRSKTFFWLVALAAALALSGCTGSAPTADDPAATTDVTYLIDPLEPGTGFIQLGVNRYAFDGVICATGAVESDPEGTTRIFGIYANFQLDDKLAAVSLTRYRSQISGKVETVPTITDTATIRMQGDGEVLGLKAQRARVVGQHKWKGVYDPKATTELITRAQDRYEVDGRFGPVDASAATAGSAVTDSSTAGRIAARCPKDSEDQAKPSTVPLGPESSVTNGESPTSSAGSTTTVHVATPPT